MRGSRRGLGSVNTAAFTSCGFVSEKTGLVRTWTAPAREHACAY